MKIQQPSEDEVFSKVDDTFAGLDQERLAGLQHMQQLQTIKQQAQQREKERLSKKHGEDHPRVVKIAERMRYDKAANIELQYEIEKSQITPPDFDRNSWLVHGRVLDQNRKGAPGLTLSLYDENKQWVEALGHTCTNDQGYFVLRYRVEEGQQSRIPNTRKLFLTVTDANNQLRHRETEPVYVSLGMIDYRLIILGDESGPCTPPKSGSGGGVNDLPRDAWIVRGTVSDKDGNAQAGLVVSLYDKELLFVDYLGATTTDSNGHFQLTYLSEAFIDLFDSNPELYLKIQDSNGRQLYKSKKTVRCNVGKVEEFNIILS